MGCLPHTFKFKTNHNTFFRRIHNVASVKLLKGQDGLFFYEVLKHNGTRAVVPYSGTIVMIGKKIYYS